MLVGEPTLTHSGMPWPQIKHVFEQMSHLREGVGIGWGAKQILQGMQRIEQCPVQFHMVHAHAYIGATASYALKGITYDTNSRYIESVGAAFHTAKSMFCQQGTVLPKTVTELARDVGMSVRYDQSIPPHALAIINNVIESMRKGHYKDLHGVRSELLRYIDGIMESEHSDHVKTLAVQACCFILMHFH